MIHFD